MSNVPATATPARRGLWRWSVALLATVLLVVVGSGLVAFAQSGAGASRGPVFLPAEHERLRRGSPRHARRPGDAMAEFMSAFPGFADTGSFMTKSWAEPRWPGVRCHGAAPSPTRRTCRLHDRRDRPGRHRTCARRPWPTHDHDGAQPPIVVGLAIKRPQRLHRRAGCRPAWSSDVTEEAYGAHRPS